MPRSHPSSAQTESDERGNAAPLLLLFIAVVLACGAAVARAGSRAILRATAQASADAVALALVTGGKHVAVHVASASHSVILGESVDGNVVHVVVRTGGVIASATAAG